jgi:acyl-coenzyme A thioesterase PaaI-like protein
VFVEKDKQRVYGAWCLGDRVCGHPGIVHGGVTALLLDEMMGQVRAPSQDGGGQGQREESAAPAGGRG